ncbi:MAG: YqgE/AlgH family protein [Alcaligenaceae bacterium]|nr:YqgE/AlgH family protein [Alcaligenaceae bacterium]
MTQEKQNSLASDQGFDSFNDFSGHFLLAMPGVDSGVFNGSLIYLFEHSPEGAGGVIINRATDIELSDLVERFEIAMPEDLPEQVVFFGGPVQPMRGFVLHPKMHYGEETVIAESENALTPELLVISNSREVLEDYVQGKGPEQAFICFGYAGWGEGQLEDELKENVWLTIPADHDLIFKHPIHDRYNAALAILGIEFSSLSSQVGHA